MMTAPCMTNEEIIEAWKVYGSYNETARNLNCSTDLVANAVLGFRQVHPKKVETRKRICCYPGCREQVKPGNWMLCGRHAKVDDGGEVWYNFIGD